MAWRGQDSLGRSRRHTQSDLATPRHQAKLALPVINNAGVFVQPSVAEDNVVVVSKIDDDTRNGFLIALNLQGNMDEPLSGGGGTIRQDDHVLVGNVQIRRREFRRIDWAACSLS